MTQPVVTTFGLTRRFGDRTAVENLHLVWSREKYWGSWAPTGRQDHHHPHAGRIIALGWIRGGRFRPDQEPDFYTSDWPPHRIPGFYDRLSAEANLRFFASFTTTSMRTAKQIPTSRSWAYGTVERIASARSPKG